VKLFLRILGRMILWTYCLSMIGFELYLSLILGYTWHLVFMPALLLACSAVTKQLSEVINEPFPRNGL
jgi:hypothetical protein